MSITQRFSYQREQIYAAVRGTTSHPTADMVYTWLKPDLPRLSLGTVYRNLHQMAQEGRLRELPGPVVRFDANTAPHTHFCCRACGSVLDMDLPYDPALDAQAEAQGWTVHDHNLLFYGICPACLGNPITTEETTLERGK